MKGFSITSIYYYMILQKDSKLIRCEATLGQKIFNCISIEDFTVMLDASPPPHPLETTAPPSKPKPKPKGKSPSKN